MELDGVEVVDDFGLQPLERSVAVDVAGTTHQTMPEISNRFAAGEGL